MAREADRTPTTVKLRRAITKLGEQVAAQRQENVSLKLLLAEAHIEIGGLKRAARVAEIAAEAQRPVDETARRVLARALMEATEARNRAEAARDTGAERWPPHWSSFGKA